MQHLHQGCYSGSVGCNRYISVPGEDSPDMHPAPLEVGYVLNNNVREAGSGMVCFLDPVTLDSHLSRQFPCPCSYCIPVAEIAGRDLQKRGHPPLDQGEPCSIQPPGKHRHRNQPGGVQCSLKLPGKSRYITGLRVHGCDAGYKSRNRYPAKTVPVAPGEGATSPAIFPVYTGAPITIAL